MSHPFLARVVLYLRQARFACLRRAAGGHKVIARGVLRTPRLTMIDCKVNNFSKYACLTVTIDNRNFDSSSLDFSCYIRTSIIRHLCNPKDLHNPTSFSIITGAGQYKLNLSSDIYHQTLNLPVECAHSEQ